MMKTQTTMIAGSLPNPHRPSDGLSPTVECKSENSKGGDEVVTEPLGQEQPEREDKNHKESDLLQFQVRWQSSKLLGRQSRHWTGGGKHSISRIESAPIFMPGMGRKFIGRETNHSSSQGSRRTSLLLAISFLFGNPSKSRLKQGELM